MGSTRLSFAFAAIYMIAGSACFDPTSATDLDPNGPPKIEQVRMFEDWTDSTGAAQAPRRVFAFGSHPQSEGPQDEHEVTTADPKAIGPIRIIMSELLLGNYLQQIECRGVVGTDVFDNVPLGSTPDDIAKCSEADDLLPQTCTGPNAVCICHNAAGCNGIAMGQPVGVLDVNQDGAADTERFTPGAVGITCTGPGGDVDVPIDDDNSYWQPSGDQQVPAVTGGVENGFDELGPAIVLVPSGAMPTSTTCHLTFDPSVIDKNDHLQVCAPGTGTGTDGGRPISCDGNLFDCTQTCTPGDVSVFTFGIAALVETNSTVHEGDVGVNRTDVIIVDFNAPVSMTSLANITMTPTAGLMTTIDGSAQPVGTQIRILPTDVGGLAANTSYTLTIPTTVTDAYNQPLSQAVTIHFMTGP